VYYLHGARLDSTSPRVTVMDEKRRATACHGGHVCGVKCVVLRFVVQGVSCRRK
jgi:hypothetical protein